MKAQLFQTNDETKILVILPNEEFKYKLFTIKDIPFEDMVCNEIRSVGIFDYKTPNEIIQLLEPDVVFEEDKNANWDISFNSTKNSNHKYLSWKVPSLNILNQVYSSMLLFKQYRSIMHQLKLK